eukprot:CAMPEP_0114550750 /NCGR_PEP_ID=MMETSP0114-20121206/6234_1 /TAXON_ID=31324 /ORGANISM="Goniomonas sp, Strain m" /LENGTH=307 /DNA_ID=CAMNT_0001735533 /DNA_START=24 /DNA_END=947 /DNA_ORIENTATION=-
MSWLVGVGLSCCGNTCVALSYALQRYAHTKVPSGGKVTSLPVFWLGLILMAPGELGNFFALGMIPASVVAPLGALTIMFSALLGRFLLGEELLRKGYYGAVVLVLGAACVICSTPQQTAPSGLDELRERLANGAFIVFAVVLWIGAAFAFFKPNSLLPNVFLMGVIACFCSLSTKTVSFMAQTGDTRWTEPLALGVLGTLICMIVLQLSMFQRVLSRFGVSLVVPLHFVQYTILTSIGATLLYGELINFPANNMILFIAGCLLCFLGSWLVSSARPQQRAEAGEEMHSLQEDEKAPLNVEDLQDSQA